MDSYGEKYLQKAANPAFKLKNMQSLIEITRNIAENPLLESYAKVREKLGTGFELNIIANKSNIVRIDGIELGYDICTDIEYFYKTILSRLTDFKSGKNKVVTYTNNSVMIYNKHIRTALGYTEKLNIYDILMGYMNLGSNNNLNYEKGCLNFSHGGDGRSFMK
uniref:Uncharacterized protein n=1 Tax=viral metagenome TaxID=1070528 RepID=A0A6C0J6P2_9ZZZZ